LLLSVSSGAMILVAATLFALGKTFFWPTMLGVVAERFPKGGALTLNITGGVGMIAAGVIGAVILGFVQDKQIDSNLTKYDMENTASLHSTYATDQKYSIFGNYQSVNTARLVEGPAEDQQIVKGIQDAAKKEALKTVSVFPVIMLATYIFLLVYFRSKGGYKAIVLEEKQPEGAMAS